MEKASFEYIQYIAKDYNSWNQQGSFPARE